MGAVKQLWIEQNDALLETNWPSVPTPVGQVRRLLEQRLREKQETYDPMVARLSRHHRELKAAPGQAPINATQYQLLSMLLARAKPGCWPCMTISELAELAGIGIRATRYALADLQGRGLLKRVELSGRASTYDLSGVVEQLQSFKEAA